MDPTIIEQATIEDLPRLTDFLTELFSIEEDFVPDQPKQMRGLRLILEEPKRGRIFVLRHDGAIIGMINLLFTISTAEGGFVVLLEDLVIHRDYRGQGFGDKLLQYAIDYATQKGFLRITLLADPTTEGSESQHFFKKHGFITSSMVPMRYYFSPK